MKKILLTVGIVLLVILGVLTYFRVFYTKSFSPEATVEFENGDLRVSVFYNSPSKKGREIFAKDGLVPFGKVWRTGANEPTTFETNKDLDFGGKKLKAGKYSLWTIPGEQTWTIIFNSEVPSWGVDFNGQANRSAEKDALTVEVPVVNQDKVFERFTISVEKSSEDMELIFLWDQTLVSVPFAQP
jgi:Protein of unknown function (DUF2911).